MQKIIKGTGPSRQLFETVKFAFMKIFDFLVKIAIFLAFLLFRGRFASRVKAKIELGGYIIELNFGKVHHTIFEIFLISNSHDILAIVSVEFPNVVQLFYSKSKKNIVISYYLVKPFFEIPNGDRLAKMPKADVSRHCVLFGF